MCFISQLDGTPPLAHEYNIGDPSPCARLQAFAAQYLACERALKLNREVTNVNGSGIGLGHPVGCTGARTRWALGLCRAGCALSEWVSKNEQCSQRVLGDNSDFSPFCHQPLHSGQPSLKIQNSSRFFFFTPVKWWQQKTSEKELFWCQFSAMSILPMGGHGVHLVTVFSHVKITNGI